MMIKEKQPLSTVLPDSLSYNQEAGCLYALITGKRPVSRRNRAAWYLNHLNKTIHYDPEDSRLFDDTSNDDSEILPFQGNDEQHTQQVEVEGKDIHLVSITSLTNSVTSHQSRTKFDDQNYLVTPNTRVIFLSRSIATSIILDLSPSVVSVSPQNDCVFLDSMFDALKRALHLLVKSHEIPSSPGRRPIVLSPKVFISVMAYTPFVVAKNNQVLVENRRISSLNIDLVLAEVWNRLNRLTQEVHELVSNTCGMSLDFDNTKSHGDAFTFPHTTGGIIRHPGSVLEDIYELGLFSCSLMPRLSRLSLIIVTDGLFASTNNLNIFRLKSIAVSFVTLGTEVAYPDSSFGYTPYIDLMKFTSKTTLGFCLTHQDLIILGQNSTKTKDIPLLSNPLYKLFCWTIHSDIGEDQCCQTPRATNFLGFEPIMEPLEVLPEHAARFFCVDQPASISQPTISDLKGFGPSNNFYNDWRSFRQLDRNLDADFEQVLACLLREGYLIKSIQFKHKETSKIVARLVLHWRHNLDLEQELTAPYWNQTDLFDIKDSNQLLLRPFNAPLYGDTYCELIVHGSYSFLHNLYCDRRTKRRSEFRDIAYRQFRQLIDGVLQTYERLQYLSRFYRDSSLSKVPSYLLHGNSLLYEQPHTHRLTSTIDNVSDETKTSEFQEYWQKISCLDTRSWKNLMHIHTLRLVLEHDQPKHKNIHCQNANGRYTHVQCRRSLSSISNFIKEYASFALLEDTTYIKFIYNKDDDLREIETSATKGFIVIRINKLLPIIVIYLMFTSGILDSHRVQIVSYLEQQLTGCKLRNTKNSTVQMDNILKSKTISPSSESCCVLIRSPLERMLKVYSRNFINDYLLHNWSHGLPGSCPYTMRQPPKANAAANEISNNHIKSRSEIAKEQVEGYTPESSINRYNLVFGKYLYGVRTVQTISNLPHDIISSLAANVLSKISAILVNIRIKQGFHIAFNNSGILNLVVEVAMKDHSNKDDASSCLCQYIVFPPTATNSNQNMHTILSGSNTNNNIDVTTSKPHSLTRSIANSGSYAGTNAQDSTPHMRGDNGEIKIIKEYWIEQQYGISSASDSYHKSIQGMRYPEIVDHLFAIDSSIFKCLLTYELLQLMCDKLSLYYELDSCLARTDSRTTPVVSPTTSIHSSSNLIDGHRNCQNVLPSTLIEGNTKDYSSKIPLLEVDYKFSLVKFFKYCQQATLNVLLFKDRSDFYEPADQARRKNPAEGNNPLGDLKSSKNASARKTSIDVKDLEDHPKKEHRSSYQHDTSYNFINSIYSQSFNHMFLETIHKQLKHIHDKEFKLSNCDRENLPMYLKHRRISNDTKPESDTDSVFSHSTHHNIPMRSGIHVLKEEDDIEEEEEPNSRLAQKRSGIDWRCFLRRGNQENLMIVLIPASLDDVNKWLNFVNSSSDMVFNESRNEHHDTVCPIFVFRCSSTMINDYITSFMEDETESCWPKSSGLEADISLHFGMPCKYIDHLETSNDELTTEILPLLHYGALNQATSDEKTIELVHFRAFLKKIRNTVLKSRFSSLNDAYLSELFIHKDDILYYINNVDIDTQKKYHVSSQLKSLAEFIKNYEEYNESLPKEPGKPCNKLLNSILLQKCGLFINQPIARFDESNPLIKQLNDKKLLFLMRCNYKIELPVLEESLAGSSILKNFVTPQFIGASGQQHQISTPDTNSTLISTPINESPDTIVASSLGKTEGLRVMEMKCGSVGAAGSPNIMFSDRIKMLQAPRSSSNTTLSSFSFPTSDSHFILEAFRGSQSWSMKEIPKSIVESDSDISLRHEAHMVEVLKKASERKESHHYRRVLKSKGNYNQSHSAIDQALKRVDSLGRLEHFCLTPLLFSPSWRSRLAPVRDHTIESEIFSNLGVKTDADAIDETTPSITSNSSNQFQIAQSNQEDADEDRWHQMVCNNYIKEYEQYIQTLGFNSVQIRYQSNAKTVAPTPMSNSTTSNNNKKMPDKHLADITSLSYSPNKQAVEAGHTANKLRKESLSTSTASLQATGNVPMYNPGYLIKFLNSGCLVFKVGFCRPYVYSILYSIEGERFNNSNTKISMTAFLDELDNIKVTMHLHSFTYDYHLRSMCSYISGRQLTFSPGYHLISFLDDFIKYYQKAPNYARSHILCGEVNVNHIKVSGQQLYNYIVTHNSVYNMEVLEMSPSVATILANLSTSQTLIDCQKQESISVEEHNIDQESTQTRSHANNYVLIELKREKVRYRDGKDPDIFECGLLITHDIHQTNSSKNSLTLKYFLLLTNQRDLYPKLIHNYDSIMSFGCHKPIRLGLAQLENRQQNINESATTAAAPSICDEEITYLGYFSSDEMDMLKFLQEKTANLRVHIEQVVRMAEVHYRRDYLWHKLMQRSGTKFEESPLTTEELVQLLKIVDDLDLATLDAQLSVFTTMHLNWYMKLLKAFNDLKQSSFNQHRIYTVKASKLLLLFIDPKCTTAFILLSVDSEKGSAELNMMLKDKQECTKIIEKTPSNKTSAEPIQIMPTIEIDQDCQQLLNDFINFCATFMWSTFLTQ